ncbi:DUF1801 domain-containing protein [uncultured Dokdonia sp.]|uniref:DUF1801 domain-containing protein n=1 Tax=uncultured Dokdonia sp. TaxID=575653 RepID=UPI00260AF706|nr:DUF1801 domain-containing protein [uncultured Dokdonia sp.]
MNPAENYIVSKPEPWRTILMELQAIIKHTIPNIEEQYKWHLPFYKVDGKMCCFLNFRKTFVDVGFINGIHIAIHKDHLVAGEKRKTLRSLRYYSLEDIDVAVLQDILHAAVALHKNK